MPVDRGSCFEITREVVISVDNIVGPSLSTLIMDIFRSKFHFQYFVLRHLQFIFVVKSKTPAFIPIHINCNIIFM